MTLRWMRQGPFLLATAGALAATGLVFRSWMPVAVALPLVVFLLLGVGRAALVREPNPTFHRDLPVGDIVLREPFYVTLGVNIGPQDGGIYEIHDELPEYLEVIGGGNALLANLKPGEAAFPYTLRCHARGRIPLGPIQFRRWDPWHFFAVEGKAEVRDTVTVEVRQETNLRLWIPYRRRRQPYGPLPVISHGLETEFFAIRDYNPLDDRRRINWRASSRWEDLFSNEYEPERTFDLVLLADLRPEANLGPVGEDAVVAIQGAAVVLLERALADHSRVALLLLREGLHYVPLGSGRRRRGELVDQVLSPPKGQYALASLPVLVSKTLPRGALLLVLSSLVDDTLHRTLVRVAKSGHDMMVITPEPAGYVDPPDGPVDRLALGLLLLRRRVRLEELRRFALVLEWRRGTPVAGLLRRPRRGW